MSATWAGGLARAVDDLGDAGAQGALGVDAGEAQVVGGKGAQAFEGVVGRECARRHVGQEPAKLLGGHVQFRRMFVKAREPA